MIRNLKASSLALVAVFALGEMVASTASAQETKGLVTADGPALLEGTDTVGQKSRFVFPGLFTIECHGTYTIGEVNATPHELMDMLEGETSFTVSPHYSCITQPSAPVTITMNGCDYALHLNTTNATPGRYEATTDIACPVGNAIEAHVYSNSTHVTSICTVTLVPQIGRTGTFLQETGDGTLTLGGKTSILATKHQQLSCGAKAEFLAEFESHVLIQGTNELGEETDLLISERDV